MAPSAITEDYYLILELEQTATPALIVSSYRRLARKLHPDKNAGHDATEAFQKLGRAYETLKDESKRRAYDLIYPSLKRSYPSQSTPSQQPHYAYTPKPETSDEAVQIAAIHKSKQERSARWRTQKNMFDSSIFEIQRRIRRLEQDIANIDSIFAAEAAEEARKNSWTSWLLSPLYKKAEDSDTEKERKDRARQERKIEKDLKERRLCSYQADLETHLKDMKSAKEGVDAADRIDDEKIWYAEAKIRARENRERQERDRKARERQEKERQERERQERERQERERQERERMAQFRRQEQERERKERERMAEFWKQEQERQMKQQREVEEVLRKQQEDRAAERERRGTQNFQDRHARPYSYGTSTAQAYTTACRHDGWWPKVQGRAACPECGDSWTYLLECPGCVRKACPRCQAAIRPRKRTNRHVPPRARTPIPEIYDEYDW